MLVSWCCKSLKLTCLSKAHLQGYDQYCSPAAKAVVQIVQISL